jgi:hypothetical protein
VRGMGAEDGGRSQLRQGKGKRVQWLSVVPHAVEHSELAVTTRTAQQGNSTRDRWRRVCMMLHNAKQAELQAATSVCSGCIQATAAERAARQQRWVISYWSYYGSPRVIHIITTNLSEKKCLFVGKAVMESFRLRTLFQRQFANRTHPLTTAGVHAYDPLS